MARANIRQIEAFNAVMKSGSVTRAAEALFISQPAVSKLVAAFEDSCGFKLFNRSSGRLVPSPEARQLFIETQKLEGGVTRVQNTAKAIREMERGEVSVVGFPAISMQLIPRTAAALIADRPEVRVSLLTRTSRSIEDAMITRSADFGISLLPADAPELSCEPFARTSMVCALPRGHRLADRPVVSLSDLAGERLVALGRADLSYPIISAGFEACGITMEIGAEVQMADAACAMVNEGIGVSIVPSLVSVGPVHSNLVFRPLVQELSMTLWIVTSAFGELSRLANSLREAIRQEVQNLEIRTARAVAAANHEGVTEPADAARDLVDTSAL